MPKSIPGVMREYKAGQLHSGASRGPVVKNPKQAVAIALSEQRQLPQKMAEHGAKVKAAHAHLMKTVPGFQSKPAAHRMRAIQSHIRNGR